MARYLPPTSKAITNVDNLNATVQLPDISLSVEHSFCKQVF